MKFLLFAIGLCSAAIFAAPSLHTTSLKTEIADCESLAPLTVEILSSEVSQGIADIVYRVTPLLDAVKIESSFDLPRGATLLSHQQAGGETIAADWSLAGRAKVRLPEGAARITLRATIAFAPTPAATEAIERASVLRDLTWGDYTDSVDLPLVQSGDEMTLDMPATRTGGDL